jgi:hypothetical protein
MNQVVENKENHMKKLKHILENHRCGKKTNATKKNETHHHAHAAEHDNNHAAIPLRYPQIPKKLNTPARPEQDHRSDLLGTECHETRT